MPWPTTLVVAAALDEITLLCSAHQQLHMHCTGLNGISLNACRNAGKSLLIGAACSLMTREGAACRFYPEIPPATQADQKACITDKKDMRTFVGFMRYQQCSGGVPLVACAQICTHLGT
jgi:hypothetical protein